MMVFFPMLMYYLWACLWFYDGQLIYPRSLSEIQPFVYQIWAHVKDVC